jgi:predicted ATPase
VALDFKNIKKSIENANACKVQSFIDSNKSYTNFITEISIKSFRHLVNVKVLFSNPVTVLSGSNKVGKTSLLLLLACSHEEFMKLDASKPEPTIRPHVWKDMMSFTKYETESKDYSYRLAWRLGTLKLGGEGKRLASSQAWSGLGKKAADRINAKIKKRQVRFNDLDRLTPARAFSASLLRKANNSTSRNLSDDVSNAFAYVLEMDIDKDFKIMEVSGHVNKRCYVIDGGADAYSSYNAASGEECLISILRDCLESPPGSLILIDEIEAGLHPTVQRRLCDVISMISWEQKKQFVITSHSPTVIGSFAPESRRFLEKSGANYKVLENIHPRAALSKMDAVGHPLLVAYVEDDLSKFLIEKALIDMSKSFDKLKSLIEVCRSDGCGNVKTDLIRHEHRFHQRRAEVGYCAIMDGDMVMKDETASIVFDHRFFFIYPYEVPEIFLAKAYLSLHPNNSIENFIRFDNPHAVFQKMAAENCAANESDARHVCYEAFKKSDDFPRHLFGLSNFLQSKLDVFSEITKG